LNYKLNLAVDTHVDNNVLVIAKINNFMNFVDENMEFKIEGRRSDIGKNKSIKASKMKILKEEIDELLN